LRYAKPLKKGVAMNAKDARKRLAALLFLLCFFMVALLSEGLLIVHTHHAHFAVNDECAVCAYIQTAENLVRQFGAGPGILGSALCGLFLAAVLAYTFVMLEYKTLVKLKTRLNN